MDQQQARHVHWMVLASVPAGFIGALTSPVTGGLLAILAAVAYTTVLDLSASPAGDPDLPA